MGFPPRPLATLQVQGRGIPIVPRVMKLHQTRDTGEIKFLTKKGSRGTTIRSTTGVYTRRSVVSVRERERERAGGGVEMSNPRTGALPLRFAVCCGADVFLSPDRIAHSAWLRGGCLCIWGGMF